MDIAFNVLEFQTSHTSLSHTTTYCLLCQKTNSYFAANKVNYPAIKNTKAIAAERRVFK